MEKKVCLEICSQKERMKYWERIAIDIIRLKNSNGANIINLVLTESHR